jgi:paraquat-inducible protein B
MAENIERDNLPQATIAPTKRMRISAVWIIPIFAAVVAIGIAINSILSEGPTITITFKSAEGVEAGQVIAYILATDGKGLEIKVFVNAPYDQYVNPGTRFWNASGVDVSVGADGVDVRTQSLVALLAGGLAFDTPQSSSPKPNLPPQIQYLLCIVTKSPR